MLKFSEVANMSHYSRFRTSTLDSLVLFLHVDILTTLVNVLNHTVCSRLYLYYEHKTCEIQAKDLRKSTL